MGLATITINYFFNSFFKVTVWDERWEGWWVTTVSRGCQSQCCSPLNIKEGRATGWSLPHQQGEADKDSDVESRTDGGKATSLCRPHCNIAAPPTPFPAQKEEKKSLWRVHKSPPIASILRGGSPGGRQRLRRGDVEDGADAQEEAAEDGPKLWDQVELHHLTQVGVVAGGVGLKLDGRKQKMSCRHRQPRPRHRLKLHSLSWRLLLLRVHNTDCQLLLTSANVNYVATINYVATGKSVAASLLRLLWRKGQ